MPRSRCALLAVVYAVVMAYASTIVGVAGPHFVPIDPSEALRRLIHIAYVDNGSDQRADWMGNLIMLVPLGFLVAGGIARRPSSWSAAVPREIPGQDDGVKALWRFVFPAFVLCFGFIVLVKYAQLFFPPRTVTLNYVLAQSVGVIIGILLFGATRSPLSELRRNHGRLESLRTTLRIYTGLLILFMLIPLDFALNADDLTARFDKLPDTVFGFNGEDRPPLVRLAVAVSGILAVAPIGAMLTLVGRGRIYVGRSTSAVAWIGCFAMLVVYALTTLVISGSASLPAVAYRTVGIALGSWFMHWLTRKNPDEVRQDLRDLVPRAIPIYLLTLFGVNGLLSLDWDTPRAAAGDLYGLGLLPLFNYYIVSKAEAAKNIVGHAAMYAPIGVMIGLRLANGTGRTWSLVLAAFLSAMVEAGRFLRPGLAPDINAVPLAAVSAWATAAVMPAFWQMLSAVPLGRTVSSRIGPGEPASGWRDRDGKDDALGEVEHY